MVPASLCVNTVLRTLTIREKRNAPEEECSTGSVIAATQNGPESHPVIQGLSETLCPPTLEAVH